MAASAAQATRLQTAALRLPFNELAERARLLDERLAELERAHQDARDLLARGVDRALATLVDAPLTGLARDRRPALEAELEDVAASNPGSARKLAGDPQAWIDARVTREFDLLAPRYATEISSELRVMENRHAARINGILAAVSAAAQAALQTDLTTSPSGTGLRRPPAFTFKLDDPEDTLECLVATGRALLPGALGRRLVIKAARERLLAMTDRHAGRLRSALVQRIREAAREYGDELEAAVDAACDAIRLAIARAREAHSDQRESTQRRLSGLQARERRLHELAARLDEVTA
jgi:hypothetical protein